MPNKKKKFNARFPPARIKKIMQTDEEIGKVAAAVPVLISKALEHFIETLMVKASEQTLEKNAKTLTTSHIKQCIHREKVFDFLKDLVVNIPDLDNTKEDNATTSNSGQNSKQNRYRAGSGKKRKPGNVATNDFTDEETSSSKSEDDEEDDDSLNRSTSHHPAGVQYTKKGSSTNPEPVHEFNEAGSSVPPLCTPMQNFVPNYNYMIPTGQYKPRNQVSITEDEDYDT